jgi:2-keto-4-pentenoate hydratase/2-oxohepta-3-ene-1,7-dioic acid hydratase in catechol pathway
LKFIAFNHNGVSGVGVLNDGYVSGRLEYDQKFPGEIDDLVRCGETAWRETAALSSAPTFALASVEFRPPLTTPNKIICVGLNYRDHTDESGYQQPDYPTLFTRFTTSFVGHLAPIVRPRVSEAFDYEGELVAVIGREGRHIAPSAALSHVAGYSIFNDGSIRDYQHRTPQWTVGKNFDATGSFGPVFVTAAELPQGARGLDLQTRLNGQVVQSSNTDRMIFDVATLVSIISEAMTLLPGDLIVTGTPAGVGHSRNPKLYMKPGDVVEVEIEGIGTLRNPITEESVTARQVA